MKEIKICGITKQEEIEYLNELKVQYAGFVFTQSKRAVNIGQANELIKCLDKDIQKVGVFKDNSLTEILEILMYVPLNVVQLHGNEDKKFISDLKERISDNVQIWKALSVKDEDKLDEFLFKDYSSLIDMYVIDGDNPGSGEAFSLETLKQKLKNCENKIPYLLAGGITPKNALKRAEEVCALGVDVSSGVEIIEDNMRSKSFNKIRELINNLKFENTKQISRNRQYKN